MNQGANHLLFLQKYFFPKWNRALISIFTHLFTCKICYKYPIIVFCYDYFAPDLDPDAVRTFLLIIWSLAGVVFSLVSAAVWFKIGVQKSWTLLRMIVELCSHVWE